MNSCRVRRQDTLSKGIYRLELEAESIVRDCGPGQFVHLLVNNGYMPFLRRPFSIHRIHSDAGTIELVYRIIGKGTDLMSELRNGDAVDLMGPLGSGFKLTTPFDHAVIVAGGMGCAPAFFLIDRLLDLDRKITFFWGVKSSGEFFDLDALEEAGVEIHTASEDGKRGHHGLVTDLLNVYFDRNGTESMAGFACGPDAMLRTIQDQSRQWDITWQVSLESIMACGEGVCMGCAVALKQGGYHMVCKDGPVFDLREINFDE